METSGRPQRADVSGKRTDDLPLAGARRSCGLRRDRLLRRRHLAERRRLPARTGCANGTRGLVQRRHRTSRHATTPRRRQRPKRCRAAGLSLGRFRAFVCPHGAGRAGGVSTVRRVARLLQAAAERIDGRLPGDGGGSIRDQRGLFSRACHGESRRPGRQGRVQRIARRSAAIDGQDARSLSLGRSRTNGPQRPASTLSRLAEILRGGFRGRSGRRPSSRKGRREAARLGRPLSAGRPFPRSLRECGEANRPGTDSVAIAARRHGNGLRRDALSGDLV